jgi:hypothetical protein
MKSLAKWELELLKKTKEMFQASQKDLKLLVEQKKLFLVPNGEGAPELLRLGYV